MNKKIFALALATILLFGCGGTPVAIGGFSFTLPSSWTISSQTNNSLDLIYASGGEEYPFTVEYTENALVEEDLLLSDKNGATVYELGACDVELCYGLFSDAHTGELTFTEGENTSSFTKYDIMADAQAFAKSATAPRLTSY